MSPHHIGGLHHLAGLDPARVLVLAKDVEPSVWSELQAALPQAQHVSLGGPAPDGVDVLPRSVPAALPRLVGSGATAVVLARPYRGLKMLACSLPVRRRLTLEGSRLVPFEPWQVGLRELEVLDRRLTRGAATDTVTRGWRRTQRGLQSMAFAGVEGVGNDYSHLQARVDALPADWARRRASVILPVYNRRPILEKTLMGLLHQTYPRDLVEVIVADDGSSDHPEALVEQYRDALDIRVVAQEDLGFRAARVRNLGMAEATGDVVMLLDCDMLPAPNHLQSVLRWFHVTEEPLVVIGDRIFVDTDGVSAEAIRRDFSVVERLPPSLAPSAVRRAEAPTEDWRRYHYRRYRGLRDHSAPYQFAASGNLAFWRREAEAVGGFDETYTRWGGEDVEFGYRLYRRGAYVVPELEAAAYHQDHPDAVVREEDARTTREMTRQRIPHRRVNEPGVRYRVPKVAVLAADAAGAESAAEQRFEDVEIFAPAAIDDPRAQVLTADDRVSAALDASRAEYLLVVPAGARLLPDAIGALLGPIEEDPAVVLVGGDLVDARGGRAPGPPAQGPHLFRVRDGFRVGGDWPALAARGVVRRVDQPVAEVVDLPAGDPTARWRRVAEAAGRADLRGALVRWISDADGPESP